MASNSNLLKWRTTKPRLSKYKNKKVTWNGVKFDSQKEAHQAQMLEMLRSSTVHRMKVVDVSYQFPMPITLNGKKICTYFADFKVTFADGRVEYQDTKGYRTETYKLKKKLVEAYYSIKIVEI